MNWNTFLILVSVCVSCSLSRPSAEADPSHESSYYGSPRHSIYGGYVRYGDSHHSYGYQFHKQSHDYRNSYNHKYGDYGNKPVTYPHPSPQPLPIPSPFPAPAPIEDIDLPQGPPTIVRPSLRIDPSQLAPPDSSIIPNHRNQKSYTYGHYFNHNTNYGTYGHKPVYPAPAPQPQPIPSPFPVSSPIEDIDLPQGPLAIVRPSIKLSKLTPSDLPVIPSSLMSSQLFLPVFTNQLDLQQESPMDINNDQFGEKFLFQPEPSKSTDIIFRDQFLENNAILPVPSMSILNGPFGDNIPFLSEPVPAVPVQIQQFMFPSGNDVNLIDFPSQSKKKLPTLPLERFEEIPIFPLKSAEEFSKIPGGSLQAVPAVPGLPVLNL